MFSWIINMLRNVVTSDNIIITINEQVVGEF